MSDETPTPADDQPSSESRESSASSDHSDVATDVATIEPAATPVAPDHAQPPAEPVTFTRKFLMPLVVPVGVAATIIFYVLNVSRVFLASDSTLAVVYASVITISILAGGSALAAAPKLRSSSLTLILGAAFLVLLMGGLISIGAASPEAASGPVECKPVTSKITIDAGTGGTLRFSFPKGNTVKAGCVDVTLDIVNGTHTLLFDTPPASEEFPDLTVNEKSWAGKLAPGEYKFHCTIPTHEAAGMVATLTVTK
jgi:plastocyanin